MRQCTIDHLKPGMILAQSVHDQFFSMLLGKGMVLTEKLIFGLQSRDLNFVYVEEEGTQGIEVEELLDIKSRKEVFKAFDSYLADVQDKLDPASPKRAILGVGRSSTSSSGEIMLIRRASDRMLKDLMNSMVRYYYPAVNLSSNPQFNHAFDVTLLSVMLGLRFHYSREELRNLAHAALLHDCGKEVLDKELVVIHPKDMTLEQQELYRKHPVEGAALVFKDININPSVAVAVEQHHERHDGSGFPFCLKGSPDPPFMEKRVRGTIFRHAEIIAVADYFDNQVNGRIEETPLTPLEAVEKLISLSGTGFHPEVVSEAISIINVFPLGCNIHVLESIDDTLIDCRGVVARVNPETLNKPEVLLLYDKRRMRMSQPKLVDFKHDRLVRLDYIYDL